MAEDQGRQHDHNEQQRARYTGPTTQGPEGPLAPLEMPSYPISLPNDPRLDGRGNGPVRTAIMIEGQRTYGNRAMQRFFGGRDVLPHETSITRDVQRFMQRRTAVQRWPGQVVPAPAPGVSPPTPNPNLSAVNVELGVACGSAGDSYVTCLNSPPVIVKAVLDVPVTPRPGSVTWVGGQAGPDELQRVVQANSAGKQDITVTLGGKSKTVHIYVVDATVFPGPLPLANLSHILAGESSPGPDFGLTVVTIGQQGVVGPEFDVTAYLTGKQWKFQVTAIRHKYKVGVHSLGRKNISGPADAPPAKYPEIRTDLTPPGPGVGNGPPRTKYWNEAITRAHEQAHVDHFYTNDTFWPARMRTFEAEVEAAVVDFDPGNPKTLTSAAVIASQRTAWQTRVDQLHAEADAAEIAGSEIYAHGVSNPMYIPIVASLVPPPPPPPPPP